VLGLLLELLALLLAGAALVEVDGDVELWLELLEGDGEEQTLLLELGADGDTLEELTEILEEVIVLET
jgi:hypothetical protein